MRHLPTLALVPLCLVACASGDASSEVATAAAAAPLPAALSSAVAASHDAPPVVIRPATAQDANLQRAQVVDYDAYLAAPATHQLFSAASLQAACAPVLTDLQFQLPRTAGTVAAAAGAGLVTGVVTGLVTGDVGAAAIGGAVGVGAVVIGGAIAQMPALTTSLNDVTSCASGITKTAVIQRAGQVAPLPVPSYDPSAGGCLVVRLGGHTITDCQVVPATQQ